MIVKYSITFALLLCCCNLFSQKELLVGINGGVTQSTIRGFDSPRELFSGTGFNFGFAFEFKISEHSSIVCNVFYDRKSIKDESLIAVPDVGFVNTERKTNYNFFSLPILYRYSITINNFQPYINAGAYIAILDNVTRNGFELFKGEFEKNEYGVTLGIGTKYKLSNTFLLSFEIRNNLGLTKINATPVDFNQGSVKTNSLGLQMGFIKKFNL